MPSGWASQGLGLAVIGTFHCLMPGNPVAAIAAKTIGGNESAQKIQEIYNDYAAKFGVDRPMWQQFFIWLKNALQGDFGVSFSQYPRTVANIISSAIWWTVALQLPAIFVGWIIGNLLGALAAYIRGVFDKVILPVFLFVSNIPAFGMAVVLLWIFGIMLKIAPTSGGMDLI